MNTSLEYTVTREKIFDKAVCAMQEVITSRGFEFYVSGCLTEKEHLQVIDDFENFLFKNGVKSDGFGSGSWEEAVRHKDTESFAWLDIPIKSADEKEEIVALYKEWKESWEEKNKGK